MIANFGKHYVSRDELRLQGTPVDLRWKRYFQKQLKVPFGVAARRRWRVMASRLRWFPDTAVRGNTTGGHPSASCVADLSLRFLCSQHCHLLPTPTVNDTHRPGSLRHPRLLRSKTFFFFLVTPVQHPRLLATISLFHFCLLSVLRALSTKVCW